MKPVFPGETLTTWMWIAGESESQGIVQRAADDVVVAFETRVGDRVVIGGGVAVLKKQKQISKI